MKQWKDIHTRKKPNSASFLLGRKVSRLQAGGEVATGTSREFRDNLAMIRASCPVSSGAHPITVINRRW